MTSQREWELRLVSSAAGGGVKVGTAIPPAYLNCKRSPQGYNAHFERARRSGRAAPAACHWRPDGRTNNEGASHGRGEDGTSRNQLPATAAVDGAVPRLSGGTRPQETVAGRRRHPDHGVLVVALVVVRLWPVQQAGLGNWQIHRPAGPRARLAGP